jgi:predicted GIY-YIG superfamily endonuclease
MAKVIGGSRNSLDSCGIFALNNLFMLVVCWGSLFHLYGMPYYAYITTNSLKNVLYVGMTNNLHRRMKEHRANKGEWKTFAGRYFCHKLVYYETFDRPMDAIRRERRNDACVVP